MQPKLISEMLSVLFPSVRVFIGFPPSSLYFRISLSNGTMKSSKRTSGGVRMKKFEEKTIQSTPIFEGKVISLKVDDVTLPNGGVSKREIINHPGAVAVIAITDDHKLLLVEQYRKALERSIIEIPAGKLEKGEKPIVTARRELEEETGYKTDDLTFVQELNSQLYSKAFALIVTAP